MIYKWRSRPARNRSRSFCLHPAIVLAACLALHGLHLSGRAAAQDDDVWISVDTRALTLSVMRADVTLKVFENIAIGSNGATRQKQLMDEKTPLGDFRINVIRPSKRFHLFLGIDFPTMDDAQRAFDEKRIDLSEYRALREAWHSGRAPPQDTRLGGHLGIHGLGAGSLEIHNNFNWTNGCIALTNDQVEELANWVVTGTAVVIHQAM